MKRLIPAFIILALIIAACAVSNAAVCRRIEDAKAQINECKDLYESGRLKESLEAALSFKANWIERAKGISAYTNHCLLDDITKLASILPEAIKQNNGFEFYSTVSQITTALNTVKREQSFTLQSLY